MVYDDLLRWLDDKILENIPTKYKRNRSDITFRCPVCGDSKKSKTKMRAHYYFSSHRFYCFNCDASLSAIKFLEFLTKNEWKDIKKEYIKLKYSDPKALSSESNLIHLDKNKKEVDLFGFKPIIKSAWKNDLSDEARKYLESRMIFDSPFVKSKQFYSVYTKNKAEYILIPWKINGVEAYFQLNDFLKHSDKKYIFPPNESKLIYGIDDIDLSFPYIICFEGVYDSLFVKNGVAIGGKNLTEFQEKILAKKYPKHQIVLAFDNDLAGKRATERTFKGHFKYKYFDWANALKTKCKDINEWVLSTKNVNLLADKNFVESCIKHPVVMKYTLELSSAI